MNEGKSAIQLHRRHKLICLTLFVLKILYYLLQSLELFAERHCSLQERLPRLSESSDSEGFAGIREQVLSVLKGFQFGVDWLLHKRLQLLRNIFCRPQGFVNGFIIFELSRIEVKTEIEVAPLFWHVDELSLLIQFYADAFNQLLGRLLLTHKYNHCYFRLNIRSILVHLPYLPILICILPICSSHLCIVEFSLSAFAQADQSNCQLTSASMKSLQSILYICISTKPCSFKNLVTSGQILRCWRRYSCCTP